MEKVSLSFAEPYLSNICTPQWVKIIIMYSLAIIGAVDVTEHFYNKNPIGPFVY